MVPEPSGGIVRLRIAGVFDSPFLRRMLWHVQRVGEKVDRRFFVALASGLATMVLLASVAVWLAEADLTVGDLAESVYWSLTTVLGQGDASFVSTPIGWGVGWLLGLFGVGIVATLTGALVGFVIDFLLKEGQGMGASGYRDHIVVCGWNTTARDLISELRSDDYQVRVVVLADAEKNPAGDGVYFVRGDSTSEEDLRRAGVESAVSAIICPRDASNEADMHSILTVLAIESIAPGVRTVVEVNNPSHVPHFERANVDEVLVTSRLASRLLARSAMYPGLTGLVTDIVSGGEGSELYRVVLPSAYVGLSVDDLAQRLRSEHRATLLAVSRGGHAHVNAPDSFKLEEGDDLVVVAESLGALSPFRSSGKVVGQGTMAVADQREVPEPA